MYSGSIYLLFTVMVNIGGGCQIFLDKQHCTKTLSIKATQAENIDTTLK